mmetsp:Transcript_120763/g.352714  ORF Transcript_120763/g.352714 Transcript_120763/m.352714 type:complete len:315 (-) Transcript_120763:770-1714(-)
MAARFQRAMPSFSKASSRFAIISLVSFCSSSHRFLWCSYNSCAHSIRVSMTSLAPASFTSAICCLSRRSSSCRLFTRLSLSISVACFASTLIFFTVAANFSVLRLSSKLATAGLNVPIIAVFELPFSALYNSRVSLEFRNLDEADASGSFFGDACESLTPTETVFLLLDPGEAERLLREPASPPGTSRSLPEPSLRVLRRASSLVPLAFASAALTVVVLLLAELGPFGWSPRAWMQMESQSRLRLMKVSSAKRCPVTCVVFSFSRPARSTKKASDVIMVLSLPPRFSSISLKMVWPRELLEFMAVAATVFMVLP